MARNIWKDKSAYGTYDGPPGHSSQWRGAFAEAASKDGALRIVKDESPWDILGLSPDCSYQAAKSAYRKLISKHHPDHGGDEEACKRVIAAWTIVSEGFES